MHYIVLALLVSLTHGDIHSSVEDEWELKLVQIVFRNGFSAPEELYPNDPNHPKVWEDGLGQLTMVGQKQLYTLGKELKKRYSNFLTDNPHELRVQSTFMDKCMNSALCLLAALYEPGKSWEFMEGLRWQPIPVSYEPPHKDKLLGSLTYCPKMITELEKIVSDDGTEVIEMYKQQLKFWTTNSGMTVKDFNQASTLYKILSAEYASNHTMPHWAWKYWDDLKCLNDYSYKMKFSDPKVLKIVGGPLLFQMVRNAIGKSEDHLRRTKIFIYSGQSVHVAGVLGAVKCFDDREPPFASMFLMELFKRKRESNHTYNYGVKLSYFNDTSHFQVGPPITLVFPGCTEICPLIYLTTFTKHWNNERSWSVDCTGRTTPKPYSESREPMLVEFVGIP